MTRIARDCSSGGGESRLKKVICCTLLAFAIAAISVSPIFAESPVRSLYANWRPITYGIAYNLNGGSMKDGETNPAAYTIEDSFTLKAPEKEGYVFLGWTGSCGTTPQASVTVAGAVGDRTYAANWEEEYNGPHGNDPCVMKNNINSFIKANRNTLQQIGFQGDGNGNFYAKAGSFGGANAPQPNIKSGTLIFSAGGSCPGNNGSENYRYAAHLGNVMNYILSQTKGAGYGSATALFPESPTGAGYDTELSSSALSKGFFHAYANTSFFLCAGRTGTGYYRYDNDYEVFSNLDGAVWW